MRLLILLAALALTGCATTADAAHCRGTNGRFIKCPPPPPPPTQTCADGTVILATAICPAPAPTPAPVPAPTPTPTPTPVPFGTWVASPLTVGGYAKLTAAEQAVPKESSYTYGEAIYRTVQAGEVVKLGARIPDAACACAGAPREWAVSGLDGKFIGYLWEANLSGVAPAP